MRSKAKELAKLLSGSGQGGTIAPALVSDQDNTSTGHFDVPAGTTAQRPVSPNSGYVRFNTDLDQLEQYTIENSWQGIAPPPAITATDVDNLKETDTTQTVVITGQNFDAGATAYLVDANGSIKNPTTSVRNSSSQITITYSGGDVLDGAVAEPLSVKVSNASGLAAELSQAITIDATPVWNTSNVSPITTVVEDVVMTPFQLSATDPEGNSVSYSLDTGAFPTGVSLNSTGQISGTPNAGGTYSSSGVNHNVTITADDSTGNTTNKTFTILRKFADGETVEQAATSALAIYNLSSSIPNGIKYINFNGTVKAVYCDIANGGWMMWAKFKDPSSTWAGSSSAVTATSNYNAYTDWGYDSSWWTSSSAGVTDLTSSNINDDNTDYKSWMFGNVAIDSGNTQQIRFSNSRDGLSSGNTHFLWDHGFNNTMTSIISNTSESGGTDLGAVPSASVFYFNGGNGLKSRIGVNVYQDNWTRGYARIGFQVVSDPANYASATWSGSVGLKWVYGTNGDQYGGDPASVYSLNSNYEQGKAQWMWVK